MRHSAMIYAKVLFELNIREEHIAEASELLENHELRDALCNPSILKQEKHRVIQRLFSPEICNFIKIMCDENMIEDWNEVIQGYQTLQNDKKQVLTATLSYVVKPEEDQIIEIKKQLLKKFNKFHIQLELKEDPSLIGGFVLTMEDMVWDRSVKSSMKRLHDYLIKR